MINNNSERTVADCKAKFDDVTKRPFGGCISVLEGLIDTGALDRFNDLADQRTERKQVLTVYLNGTFKIQSEADAHYAAQSEPDWVINIDISVLKDAMKKALN